MKLRTSLCTCCAVLLCTSVAMGQARQKTLRTKISHAPTASTELLPDVLRAHQPASGKAGGLAGDGNGGLLQGGGCGSLTITQNTDPNTIVAGTSVSCNAGGVNTDNFYARSFDLSTGATAGSPQDLSCVDFGVETNAGGDYTVTVSVYTSPAGPPSMANLTLMGTLDVLVLDATALTTVTADFTGMGVTLPADSTMVVEVFTPSRQTADGGDGGSFFVGSNSAGQSGPTYLAAAACGLNDYADTAVLGFPDMHWVVRVDFGVAGPASGACCDTAGGGTCTDNVLQTDCTFDFFANQTCASLPPPCGVLPACVDFAVTGPGSFSGDTCGAGNDCAVRGSEEQIYQVDIPTAAAWTFSLCGGATYDTWMAIGTTCCSSDIATNDDSCGLQSEITVSLAPGTYFVDIEAFGASQCGTYTLNITQGASCATDFQVTAPGVFSGDTCGAGNDCDIRASEEQMYEVTLPTAGEWTFSLCGASWDTWLAVGTTCCGTEVGTNDDSCGLQSEVVAVLAAGTYFVDVEAFSSGGCGAYDLSITSLPPCDVVCDPNATLENEPDCVSVNGGCNSSPAVYSPISCGETYCSTAGASGGTRDTDWYQIELFSPTTLTWTVEAEFDVLTFILVPAPDCNNIDLGDAGLFDSCVQGSLTRLVQPGIVWLFAAPQGFDGVACGAEYQATLTADNACAPLGGCCLADGSCAELSADDCAAAGGTFQGNGTDCSGDFQPTLCIPGTEDAVITVNVTTDNFPGETTWEVVEQGGGVAGSGGPYSQPATLFTQDVPVCSGSCYDFTIFDAFGDGICCGFGMGSYEVLFNGTLVGSGGDFADSETTANIGGCGGGGGNLCQAGQEDAVITVEVTTDNFPGETTWELDEQGGGVVATGGPYADPATLFTTDVPVCSTSCYDFTIFDAFGDGICCGFGMGSYSVFFNGTLVVTGGDFADLETTTDIGGGCGGGGGGNLCQAGQEDAVITVEVTTDNFPGETTWELDEQGGGVVATGGPYADPATLFTTDVPVCSTSCYDFTIFDAFGDGICCGFGMGSYSVLFNGTLVVTGGDFADFETTTNIGGGCGGGGGTLCKVGAEDATLTVDVLTDDFPGETTWELNEVGGGLVASAGPFSVPDAHDITDVPVCSSSCYEWTIFDAFGDGICCGFGLGSYTLSLDGVVIATGGEFADSETVAGIGDGCPPEFPNQVICCINNGCIVSTPLCCESAGGQVIGTLGDGFSCDTPPTIECPADMTVECDGAGNTSQLNAWLGSVTASAGVCGSVTVTNDFTGLSDDCGGTGSATVTWTATDDANGLSSQCSATFTIVDTTPPMVTCSGNLDMSAGGQFEGRGSSVGGRTLFLDGGGDDSGNVLIGFTATDGCGAVSVSAVLDISCPQIQFGCLQIPVVDGQMIDLECEVDECEFEVHNGILKIEAGTATLIVTATDECGNTSSCSVDLCGVIVPEPDDDGNDNGDDGDFGS